MGWFGNKDKDKKAKENAAEEEKGPVIAERADLPQSLKDFTPRFASSARTSAIQSPSGAIYFKRAELTSNGGWKVVKVEIFDASDKLEDYPGLADLPKDEQFIVNVEEEKFNSKFILTSEQEEELKSKGMNFAQAMTLLGDLEKSVIQTAGQEGGEKFVAISDIDVDDLDDDELHDGLASFKGVQGIIADKFVELDMDDDFLKSNFFDVDHFATVVQREGLMVDADGNVKPLRQGRVIEPGSYIMGDVSAANDTHVKMISNPPVLSDFPTWMQEAFGGVGNVGNLDTRLRVQELLFEMDKVFDQIDNVRTVLTGLVSDNDETWRTWEDYDNAMDAVRAELQNVDQTAKTFVGDLMPKTIYVDAIAYAHQAQQLLAEIHDSPEKTKQNAEKIRGFQAKIEKTATDCGFGPNFVNRAKASVEQGVQADVSIKILDEMIDTYQASREEIKRLITQDADKAAERAKTFAGTKPAQAKKLAAPKA